MAAERLRSVELVQEQLAFDGIPERLVRVTPAKLTTWSSCPRRYRFNYVDRPQPPRGPAMAHTTLGAVLHNALRAYYELPSEQRTATRLRELINRYWKSDGFSGAEQSADYLARALDWLSDYVERDHARGEPVGVEKWVSATVGTIIVQGRVDRIDERDGELVIVDYKAGRKPPDVDAARNSLPLALYALATQRMLHAPCPQVELHHLRTSEIVTWRHTADSLAEHRQRAERLARESRDAATSIAEGADPDRVFPARPGAQCAGCEFRRHCPEGTRAVPETDPWALLGE
ncbi:PD-(D/E)XK nuclease family protein [Actinopolyspora lacussalsi]